MTRADLVAKYLPSPLLLLVIFAFLLIGFLVVSIMLNHHWKTYTIESAKISKINKLYFTGSALLIVAALLALLLYWL